MEETELQRTAEDTASPGRELSSQDQSGPEADVLTLQLRHDHSGSVQENVAQVPVTANSPVLNTSEDMEDQEPLSEEEQKEALIVLDPEHPLVRKYQAALNIQICKRLEKLNLILKDKRALASADAKQFKELKIKKGCTDERLKRVKMRLQNRIVAKKQAEDKGGQAQDQLEAAKSTYSRVKSQLSKSKAYVSQLQVERDKLDQQLVLIERASEDLCPKFKATEKVRHKAGAEKKQAEEQKLKQDLYVDRLTKEVESLTQQIATYEVQTSAQAEETQAVKEALSEAEMAMESMTGVCKQVLQQWSSNLAELGKRDEVFKAMQEAVRTANQQLISLDSEIEGYKKSSTKEQELNETLTLWLNCSQLDCDRSKQVISQKQAEQEALQAQYSTRLLTLKESKRTLAQISKQSRIHQIELNDKMKQLEKERAFHHELGDRIMTQMQQVIQNRAAKPLTSKITTLKKEKISQLLQLQNNIAAVELESSKVSQHLDSLVIKQEALDEEIAKYNELLTSVQAKITSLNTVIKQKHEIITNYNKDIYEIAAKTGHNLNPLQIKLKALMDHNEDLTVKIKSDQQLWMKQQGTLVALTQEIHANSKDLLKLDTKYTDMQQRKINVESQIEVEQREERELEKNVKVLKGDLRKLNTLLSKDRQLGLALKEENTLMETNFLHKLKEAERESIELQMKLEKSQEEKERLVSCLAEAERQIMLWEKKTRIIKETRSAVNEGLGDDVKVMKAEIHRMKLRLNQLMKERNQLQRESVATVARRETIEENSLVKQARKKDNVKGITKCLQRRIKETSKHVTECEKVVTELQETQVSVSNELAQQKQRLTGLRGTSDVLDSDLANLQDSKDKNLSHLVSLQNRNKKLQEVCEGSYRASSTTSGSIGAALQSQRERVHAVSTALNHVCEEFPLYQGALRRPLIELEVRTDPGAAHHGGP